jgi:hypothetical protein
MSSIASFFRIPKTALQNGHGIADLLHEDLGDEYGWSGYVMLNLLLALEDSGISLGDGLGDEVEVDEDAGLLFFATSADLGAIEGLDLNQLDGESIGEDLELDEDELREAVAESVTLLHQLIAGTGPDELLVIRIG